MSRSSIVYIFQCLGPPRYRVSHTHEFQHSGSPKSPVSRITNVHKIQGFQCLQHPVLPMSPMSRVSNGASVKVFQQLQVFQQLPSLPTASSLPANPSLPENSRLPDNPCLPVIIGLPQHLPGKSTSSRKSISSNVFKFFQTIHVFQQSQGLPANPRLPEKTMSSTKSKSSS